MCVARPQLRAGGASTQWGYTPLHHAADCGHEAVARFLVVEGGADVNAKTNVRCRRRRSSPLAGECSAALFSPYVKPLVNICV